MPWRFLFGILITLIGLGLFLDQANIIPQFEMLRVLANWWPLLITILSLNYLVRKPENPWGTLVLVGLGLALLVRSMDLVVDNKPNPWPFLSTIALTLFGIRLLLPQIQRLPRIGKSGSHANFRHAMKDFTIFSSARSCNESQQFQGGKLTVVLSDYEIDLREALLSPQGAELDLRGFIGHFILRVPQHMAYRIDNKPFLGVFDNRARSLVLDEPGRPTLVVRFNTALCAVTITN